MTSIRLLGALAAAATLMMGTPALARRGPSPNGPLMGQLHRENQHEIAMGNLAQQQSADPAVKAFAQRLVTEHTQADQKLQQIAQSQRVNLKKATKPDKDDQQILSALQRVQGPEFDREFLRSIIDDHERDIQKLGEARGEIARVDDPQVYGLIDQMIPILQGHLDQARELMAATRRQARTPSVKR